VCDYNCKYRYKVIKRTEKWIWLKNANRPKSNQTNGCMMRRKIEIRSGREICAPEGRYSMAPQLNAEQDEPVEATQETLL